MRLTTAAGVSSGRHPGWYHISGWARGHTGWYHISVWRVQLAVSTSIDDTIFHLSTSISRCAAAAAAAMSCLLLPTAQFGLAMMCTHLKTHKLGMSIGPFSVQRKFAGQNFGTKIEYILAVGHLGK